MENTVPQAQWSAVDRQDMLGAVASLPDQLRQGLANVEAELAQPHTPGASPRALVVCGMGGSGVGADLLAAVGLPSVPVIAVKDYDLPGWVGSDDMVICASYSGETAETISCYEQALTRANLVGVVCSGGTLAAKAAADGLAIATLPTGLQPRAAVGWLFSALTVMAQRLGVVTDAAAIVEAAAAGAGVANRQNGAGGLTPASLAEQIGSSTVIVYGAGANALIAERWKAQINENAKLPCFAGAYPELDHNEIVGWQRAQQTGGSWALVELERAGESEAIRARMDVTASLIADDCDLQVRLRPTSTDPVEAAFEMLAFGDLLSVYLALIAGVDPTPVERIQSLKKQLAQRLG